MNTKQNNVNYQKELEKIINNLDNKKPTLLLHCCCAPCASYCLEYLTNYFDITAIYINNNIESKSEYDKRANELIRLTKEMPLNSKVKTIIYPYNGQDFLEKTKGYESYPEGGKRCNICFADRLKATYLYGVEHNFDYFTTTLTISPLKNAKLLNKIGYELSNSSNHIKWLPSDFKKKNGYLKSIELSRQYNLYRQNYCGCIFSKNLSEK